MRRIVSQSLPAVISSVYLSRGDFLKAIWTMSANTGEWDPPGAEIDRRQERLRLVRYINGNGEVQ